MGPWSLFILKQKELGPHSYTSKKLNFSWYDYFKAFLFLKRWDLNNIVPMHDQLMKALLYGRHSMICTEFIKVSMLET